MAERFFTHIAIAIVFGCFLAAAALSSFFQIWIIAVPGYLVCLGLMALQVKQKRSLQVKNVKTAGKSLGASGFSYSEVGDAEMRRHLEQSPGDYKVALVLARSLSKYRADDEGRQVYEQAVRGALRADLPLAVQIFKEYLDTHMRPLEHMLTYRLAVLAYQQGEKHLASRGLEAVFYDESVAPPMAAKSLKACIRICRELGLDDAVATYSERLAGLEPT